MLRPTMLRYEATAKRSQHNPTMLGATCCTRLATLLQHVGCCWLKYENGQIFHATFVDVACYCRRLARFGQQYCAKSCALARFVVLFDVICKHWFFSSWRKVARNLNYVKTRRNHQKRHGQRGRRFRGPRYQCG